MKLAAKKVIEAFILDNAFVKQIVIHNGQDLFYFPASSPVDQEYFETLMQNIYSVHDTDEQFVAMTNDTALFVMEEDHMVYMCECGSDVSLSQIKMGFGTLV